VIAKTLKLLGILFWIVTALFLVVFSVSNRTIIDLSFEPFEFVLPIPTYQILFFGIFIGILITGTSLSWLRLQGFARRRKAERQRLILRHKYQASVKTSIKNKPMRPTETRAKMHLYRYQKTSL